MANLSVDLTAPNGRTLSLPTGLFIDNEFVKSSSGDTIVSINPTDETEICAVESASEADVDKAVKAARRAFNDASWREIPGSARGAMILELANLAHAHRESLATLETWDNGKPYCVSLNEDVAEAINCLRYYAGWADKLHGQTIPINSRKFAYTVREPIGVCGQIIPWNYPLMMAAWKIAPALACGNTIVLKPAEQTPLSILYLASLIKQAGFPPGVINILNGSGKRAGSALASHMDVDKIAFTGSTPIGQHIMRAASSNLKNITLETGGKSPIVIFDDADVEQAAKWAHLGSMSNQGQICTANSRILVQSGIYDHFIARFIEVVDSQSIIGDPFHPDTFQGPQVSASQLQRVMAYLESGKSEGATLAYGGRRHKALAKGNKGYFVEPIVFTDVKDNMRIYKEEIFGPFVVIVPFSTEKVAIRMANDSEYGLGGAVFTKDIERAHRVSRKIDAGMVWINSSNDSDIMVPFGGVKQSGVGRELGEAALSAYSEVKAIYVNMGVKL